MTGQCDFLRKFPNFLRKQGVSAFSVYPLSLSACQSHFPAHPSSLNHLSNFNQTEGKGLMDMTALWVQGEKSSAVRKHPNYCSQLCPKRNSLATSAQPPILAGHSPMVSASCTRGCPSPKNGKAE